MSLTHPTSPSKRTGRLFDKMVIDDQRPLHNKKKKKKLKWVSCRPRSDGNVNVEDKPEDHMVKWETTQGIDEGLAMLYNADA